MNKILRIVCGIGITYTIIVLFVCIVKYNAICSLVGELFAAPFIVIVFFTNLFSSLVYLQLAINIEDIENLKKENVVKNEMILISVKKIRNLEDRIEAFESNDKIKEDTKEKGGSSYEEKIQNTKSKSTRS